MRIWLTPSILEAEKSQDGTVCRLETLEKLCCNSVQVQSPENRVADDVNLHLRVREGRKDTAYAMGQGKKGMNSFLHLLFHS